MDKIKKAVSGGSGADSGRPVRPPNNGGWTSVVDRPIPDGAAVECWCGWDAPSGKFKAGEIRVTNAMLENPFLFTHWRRLQSNVGGEGTDV
jgi:hypothetical protein